MPVHQLPNGKWRWGEHGKAYPTKAEAEKQAAAAYAHGYGEPSGAILRAARPKKS